jgi:hypothetical protein
MQKRRVLSMSHGFSNQVESYCLELLPNEQKFMHLFLYLTSTALVFIVLPIEFRKPSVSSPLLQKGRGRRWSVEPQWGVSDTRL